MQNTHKIVLALAIVLISCFSMGTAVLAQNVPQIQTLFASSIQNGSATLNANLLDLGIYSSATTYFQWGTSTSYGNQTMKITQLQTGFISSQTISGLASTTTYHYRAVAENAYGTSYGQDMTFTSVNGINSVNPTVTTTFATFVSNFQATLNGTISGDAVGTNSSVYFQWGATTSYGNETSRQLIGYSGSFMQTIANLNSGATYHFRAVATGNYGTVYGQDLAFAASGPGNGFNTGGSLTATKQVINLSSGNLNWTPSIGASPSDVLNFKIILQANAQDIHNVIVRDTLPVNLLYKGSLVVNGANFTGDIISGINIGTILAGQMVTVSYQAQVVPSANLPFGLTPLTNNATITSTEMGTQYISAAIAVNKTLVYGATTVSTGLTGNFLTDSFFLPLMLIIAGLWFYFSGEANMLADKLKAKIKR